MKKNVCLVSDWYPTDNNPFTGCFFKEQAIAMAEKYTFVIFRYKEKKKINPFKQDLAYYVRTDNNTIEYVAIAYISVFFFVLDMFYSIYMKSKRRIDGIGRYVSPLMNNIKRKKITKLFAVVREKIDVFYCVDAQSEAVNLKILSDNFHKPYIVSEHAPFPWPGSLISDLDKKAIESADIFFAISYDKIRQLLLQNIKLPKTIYIGNLIDERKFIINFDSKNNNNIKRILIVAANSYFKNYELFFKVIKRLTEITKEKFEVMLVGYGANKGYSKDIKEFEENISNLSFSSFIKRIPELKRDEMCSIYNKADVFVMTSIQEGQPVSALEAACCGVPVFSTCCGGVEDYIDDTCGRIFKITDYESIAFALKDFIEGKIKFDPNVIRNTVVSKFGRDVFIKKFVSAINELAV